MGVKAEAAMRLDVIGQEFRNAVAGLSGKLLGCWCEEIQPLCHTKILAKFADAFAAEM
jgi:hypothetical protein